MIQRMGAAGDDGHNTTPGTFADYAAEYADVRFSKGSERREAAQEGAGAAATFIVLSNERTRDVSVTDRIVFDGAIWDITSSIPSREFNAYREIEATRSLA
jgi:head-tail adaptor